MYSDYGFSALNQVNWLLCDYCLDAIFITKSAGSKPDLALQCAFDLERLLGGKLFGVY